MSSNPTPRESSDHLQQRKTLIRLEAAIDALKVHTLDASHLDRLNMKRQQMSFNKASDLTPRSFAPKPNLPKPTNELVREAVECLYHEDAFTDAMSRAYALEGDWSSYAFSETEWRATNDLWRTMSVCNYTPFKPLYKYDKPDFGVFKIMDIPEDQFPHMKAVIYHGLEGEDRTLCRGELLIILRLMLGQLKKTRLLRHKVVPILIVSFMGKTARLLESYFDGQSLVLRSSDLYEFSDQTAMSVVFKTLAEWYLGDPAGNTL